MDGFKQIRTFYSWVFNNPDKVRQSHISLYVFLINQNNRSMWVEWFKCPRDLAMAGACIGSNNTYYKVLDDLQNWNLLEYKKGINDFKAPMIKLTCLYKSEQLTEQVSAPLSETLPAPLPEQLSVQLTAPIYKLITSNVKLINSNEKRVLYFISSLVDEDKKDETKIKECMSPPIGVDALHFYIAKGYHKMFYDYKPNKTLEQSKLNEWVNTVRLLIEADKIEPLHLVTIKYFLQSGIDKDKGTDSFWSDTIYSIKALRKKGKDGTYQFDRIKQDAKKWLSRNPDKEPLIYQAYQNLENKVNGKS